MNQAVHDLPLFQQTAEPEMPDVLREAFDVLTDAPNGIAKLRELILDLAVRGKLVPQNPNDEPASKLLERIEAEKTVLVREGKIRKSKGASAPKGNECILPLPAGWQLALLDSVCWVVTDGDHVPPPKTDAGIPFLVISNISGGKLSFESTRFVSEDYYQGLDWSRKPVIGDLLYTVVGSFGIPVEVDIDRAFCVQRHVAILRPSPNMSLRYLRYALASPQLFDQARSGATGTAQKTVGLATLRKLRLPLPPLAEQKRIAAKVDALMALCDRLETRQQHRQTVHLNLHKASFAALTEAQNADDFNDRWQFIASHFDSLITTPESITTLRQTILDLAVRGKLTHQDPTDEPAKTVQVKDTVELLNGYAFKSQWYAPEGVRVVRNQNVSHGALDWGDTRHIAVERAEQFERFRLCRGDIVLGLDRPIISTGLKVAVVEEVDLPCLLLQRVARLRPSTDFLQREYLFLWLRSSEFLRNIAPGRSKGVPHISTREVERLRVSIPSLAEQRRIVAKVNALMSICDHLEFCLQQATTCSQSLADAVVTDSTALPEARP